MSDPGRIFVISGQLSAGKSTVARAIAARHPFGYHIDVDGIREMVVSGLASPLEWTDETSRQFGLALRGSAALARVYSDAGFAVVVEGGMDPASIEEALAAEGLDGRWTGVVLHPSLDVALRRNRERTHKGFDTSILEGVMREIDEDITAEGDRTGWHRLDNSDETVEETVERVLSIGR